MTDPLVEEARVLTEQWDSGVYPDDQVVIHLLARFSDRVEGYRVVLDRIERKTTDSWTRQAARQALSTHPTESENKTQ